MPKELYSFKKQDCKNLSYCKKTSLLRRLKAETLPDATPPICKISVTF